VPDEGWSTKQYESWDAFLTGGWLERWSAGILRACVHGSTVEVNVQCTRLQPVPAQFEIDVAVVRGHRLYVLSCTTSRKKAECKAKLFEVAMRSRQMGGDLARSALACLLDRGPQRQDYVEELRADVDALWDAPNVPRVFGLRDLREWAGVSGTRDTSTLRQWLDS